ncbi:Spermidine/putrescine import ATP-binding protein PotA (plasmid) [Thermus thermophilus]|uniref:Spermidine/putrescine import ATP-binding protein PotA n=1 Tax=Thermus thermophilus TaxID=274 RepID=A0A3P4AUY5_THETH|nr:MULTISPECIES: ABC transporter ATP-binding protein [Thermus]QWK21036.1 MAG: ABC transporter ATP-binding protein [Thermus antranikianii]VCU54640.1 Spermidine/putrescine import ATP-binding protein PotA [Thermus thermophilus]
MIRLEGLSKRFPQGGGVEGVDLEILEGEVFVLLGASGSGKTTLLNLVAGLLSPDRGRILLAGREITHLPPERRELAYVFQDQGLWPHLTALDHLLLVMPRPDRREALALLERVGLLDHAHKRPHQLSGGQRQRVALARALARRPRLLLLDEPYSALDPVLREELRLEVRTLLKERGTTALHVTHDPEEAMLLADRVGVMSQGRLLQVGAPKEVYLRPNSLESFLAFGRANVFSRDGEVLAFRQEWVRPGGSLEALVLERRELRGEVLCRVQLEWGEAWVRLEAGVGERVRLQIHPLLRFPQGLPDPAMTAEV